MTLLLSTFLPNQNLVDITYGRGVGGYLKDNSTIEYILNRVLDYKHVFIPCQMRKMNPKVLKPDTDQVLLTQV